MYFIYFDHWVMLRIAWCTAGEGIFVIRQPHHHQNRSFDCYSCAKAIERLWKVWCSLLDRRNYVQSEIQLHIVVIIIFPCAMNRLWRKFQQLGTIQDPDACQQAPRVSSRAQDAIPDPQRTQIVTEYHFKDFPTHFSNPDWFFPLKLFIESNLTYLRILTSSILLVPTSTSIYH